MANGMIMDDCLWNDKISVYQAVRVEKHLPSLK